MNQRVTRSNATKQAFYKLSNKGRTQKAVPFSHNFQEMTLGHSPFETPGQLQIPSTSESSRMALQGNVQENERIQMHQNHETPHNTNSQKQVNDRNSVEYRATPRGERAQDHDDHENDHRSQSREGEIPDHADTGHTSLQRRGEPSSEAVDRIVQAVNRVANTSKRKSSSRTDHRQSRRSDVFMQNRNQYFSSGSQHSSDRRGNQMGEDFHVHNEPNENRQRGRSSNQRQLNFDLVDPNNHAPIINQPAITYINQNHTNGSGTEIHSFSSMAGQLGTPPFRDDQTMNAEINAPPLYNNMPPYNNQIPYQYAPHQFGYPGHNMQPYLTAGSMHQQPIAQTSHNNLQGIPAMRQDNFTNSVSQTYHHASHFKPIMKPVDPPPFRGHRDDISAFDFLEEVKRYQTLVGCTDNDLLQSIIPNLLHGIAFHWYNGEKRILPFQSFHDFCDRFKKHFLSYDYSEQLRKELEGRTQGENERLCDYIIKILEYNRRIGLDQSDREIISRILNGLTPEYLPYFRGAHQFHTLADFKRDAEMVDAQVARARQYRPPNRYRSIEPVLQPTEYAYGLPNYDRTNHYSNYRQNTRDWRPQTPPRQQSPYPRNEQRQVTFSSPNNNSYNDRNRNGYQSRSFESPSETSDERSTTQSPAHLNRVETRSRFSQSDKHSDGQQQRSRSSSADRTRSRTPDKIECYRCKGDHRIRDCPKSPSHSGNGLSPGQKRQ